MNYKLFPWGSKGFYLALLMAFFTLNAVSQTQTISGVVSDATDGSSVIGASIIVKGTQKGVSSDMNGRANAS